MTGGDMTCGSSSARASERYGRGGWTLSRDRAPSPIEVAAPVGLPAAGSDIPCFGSSPAVALSGLKLRGRESRLLATEDGAAPTALGAERSGPSEPMAGESRAAKAMGAGAPLDGLPAEMWAATSSAWSAAPWSVSPAQWLASARDFVGGAEVRGPSVHGAKTVPPVAFSTAAPFEVPDFSLLEIPAFGLLAGPNRGAKSCGMSPSGNLPGFFVRVLASVSPARSSGPARARVAREAPFALVNGEILGGGGCPSIERTNAVAICAGEAIAGVAAAAGRGSLPTGDGSCDGSWDWSGDPVRRGYFRAVSPSHAHGGRGGSESNK
jgi:hypothetical protein